MAVVQWQGLTQPGFSSRDYSMIVLYMTRDLCGRVSSILYEGSPELS